MNHPIAIVAAMKEELDALLAHFPEREERVHFKTRLFKTSFRGRDLALVQSGVGKVNASCTLALLLSDFSPSCVLNIGTAGGVTPGQAIGDLVVPEQIVYTDVDVTPLGLAYGQMLGSPPRFETSPELLKCFRDLEKTLPDLTACHYGMLGSADSFIYRPEQIDSIRLKFNNAVECVDMEGAAIAHSCTRFGVPFLVLRALSDVPGKGDNAMDFKTFLKKAASDSASLCVKLVERIIDENLF